MPTLQPRLQPRARLPRTEDEMSDFWDNIIPLAGIACLAFFIYGLGQVIFDEGEKSQARYEQCLAADKQWVQGSCVR